ncbi:hypothetical protein [Archangium violaceum]|uniref:hypothetical protein n=1 Tax=Archangium violaceum TaxID=83451 RepID=UPI0036D91A0E
MEKPEAQQQETRPALTFDFNGNGVPDYKEPWFWSGAWTAFAWLVKTLAKSHTLAYRAVVEAEKYRAAALAGQR